MTGRAEWPIRRRSRPAGSRASFSSTTIVSSDTVSALLSADFDVVGVATDGAQALEKASPRSIRRHRHGRRDAGAATAFRPFERSTATGLRGTPGVFLSMHDADDIVGEAFRCGGRRLRPEAARRPRSDERARPGASRSFVRAVARSAVVGLMPACSDAALRRRGSIRRRSGCLFRSSRFGAATLPAPSPPAGREGLAIAFGPVAGMIGGSSGHKRYLAIDAADAWAGSCGIGLPDPERLAEVAGNSTTTVVPRAPKARASADPVRQHGRSFSATRATRAVMSQSRACGTG